MKYLISFVFFCFLSFFSLSPVFADLYLEKEFIKFIPTEGIQGKEVKIYISVRNTSSQDRRGVVRAFDLTDEKKIDVEQTFSALAGKSDDIFFSFVPKKSLQHEIAFRIVLWDEDPDNDPKNDTLQISFFVDADTDEDGIGDQNDTDDDNDGVKDSLDIFPKNRFEQQDFDGDGVGDNTDTDDDNDGILDADDKFSKNPHENNDLDNDGIGNNEDEDDDGDGIRDDAEKTRGTDHLKFDTDGDGVNDGEDDYPLNNSLQFDTDSDGTPDNTDSDDDNDGIPDDEDLFPRNEKEYQDFDEDGVGNNTDPDDDNDGLFDREEFEKKTNPLLFDTDGDGIGDKDDALPLDPTESKDSDHDGLGDNADENDDNQGPVLELVPFSPVAVRGSQFSLDARPSYDPEQGGLSFLWEVYNTTGEKEVSLEGPFFVAVFHGVGEKKIRLLVVDEKDEKRVLEIPISIGFSLFDKTVFFIFLVFLIFIGRFLYKRYMQKSFFPKEHIIKIKNL